MRGLWLARGHGTQPPLAWGLAKSTENARARASSSHGRPVVIIPGGHAATAVVLAGPLPPIERRANATGGSPHLPVPAAARLALTRTALLPDVVDPAGMITVLDSNCSASATPYRPLMTATVRHHACLCDLHPYREGRS